VTAQSAVLCVVLAGSACAHIRSASTSTLHRQCAHINAVDSPRFLPASVETEIGPVVAESPWDLVTRPVLPFVGDGLCTFREAGRPTKALLSVSTIDRDNCPDFCPQARPAQLAVLTQIVQKRLLCIVHRSAAGRVRRGMGPPVSA
jgi:hypothetical protein